VTSLSLLTGPPPMVSGRDEGHFERGCEGWGVGTLASKNLRTAAREYLLSVNPTSHENFRNRGRRNHLQLGWIASLS